MFVAAVEGAGNSDSSGISSGDSDGISDSSACSVAAVGMKSETVLSVAGVGMKSAAVPAVAAISLQYLYTYIILIIIKVASDNEKRDAA